MAMRSPTPTQLDNHIRMYKLNVCKPTKNVNYLLGIKYIDIFTFSIRCIKSNY